MRVSTAALPKARDLAPAGERLAWRMALFHPDQRATVAAVAAEHPALADLAESFPALLFALATGFGVAGARQSAAAAVIDGLPLQTAANALGLAWWTRKLPAGALKGALPEFPIDAEFSRRMASLVPASAASCGLWLQAVTEALPSGGRQYALWIGRHAIPLMGTLSDAQRHALHAWVWAAWHPGTLGHSLVRRPWSSDLGIKRVMEEFGVFLSRAALADALGPGHLGGMLPDLTVQGLTFKPLRTVFDYIRTAAELDNCLEQYGDRIRRGATAVAAIVDDGRVIACVEIGPHPTESAMPSIVQLRSAKNRRAPAMLWSAAYAWLAACDMRPLVAQPLAPTDAERARLRADLWGAYLADLARQPGGTAYHAAAAAALAGSPPVLDPTPPMIGLARGRMPAQVLPPDPTTLMQRLAWFAGRGTGRRLGL